MATQSFHSGQLGPKFMLFPLPAGHLLPHLATSQEKERGWSPCEEHAVFSLLTASGVLGTFPDGAYSAGDGQKGNHFDNELLRTQKLLERHLT